MRAEEAGASGSTFYATLLAAVESGFPDALKERSILLSSEMDDMA
jgi:hypothetical protein